MCILYNRFISSFAKIICIHIWFLGNYHLKQRMRLRYPGGSSTYRRTTNSVPILVQRVKSDPAADINKAGYLDLLLLLCLAALRPETSAETTDSRSKAWRLSEHIEKECHWDKKQSEERRWTTEGKRKALSQFNECRPEVQADSNFSRVAAHKG